MAETGTKLPLKTSEKGEEQKSAPAVWSAFDSLRHEIDRLFDRFNGGSWRLPFRHSTFETEPFFRMNLGAMPSVDLVEREDAYEITAELPGMDEKNVEVVLANGALTIKGEKREEKEEKKKDYYLSERRFGSFRRSFALPEDVDIDRIDARFSKGILTVTMPKSGEARQKEKKIDIKAS